MRDRLKTCQNATVHATIQRKLVLPFLVSCACLVWFGFLSGFPRENPLPGEKEEVCEAESSASLSQLSTLRTPPPPPPCCCIPLAQGIVPNVLLMVRSHGFHQDVFSLYVSHPFIDLFFLLLHKQDSTYLQKELLEVTLEPLEKHRAL